ncbi:DNA-J related domain-containing protein [Vibrio misgurnus]|uniref:DNA-J related domain-containing protein n=1 Tax=Vibrio misgurnus TaxID=2993714 RepID=UPI00241674C2|nr:DNA-J related domain-containing protein [Vibrio sp. gvc]
MAECHQLATTFQTYMENPLVWPIFDVLKHKPSGWKVHTLAAHLSGLGMMPVLDPQPEKDLFKRNFLIMNALFQLQETLHPQKWLQVEAMDIVLAPMMGRQFQSIDMHDPLRDYYTQWVNYEADEGEVKRLLNEFWTRYRHSVGSDNGKTLTRSQALRLFELSEAANALEIRKTWRRLALRWHPDRDNGSAERFRILCEAWNILRNEYS